LLRKVALPPQPRQASALQVFQDDSDTVLIV
jgi:hypothetical protein